MIAIRTGVRLTVAEQLSRNPIFKGRPLALDFKGPDGKQLRASEVLEGGATGIEGVLAAVATRADRIELPELIDDPRLPVKVAKGIVTGGQIAGLVRAGYEIMGHNANSLKTIVADESRASEGTGYLSLYDGRELAKELNRQNPGRKFRVPDEAEQLDSNRLVGEQLTGNEFWLWVETETSRGSGIFVLRRRSSGSRSNGSPDSRYNDGAVRLVEDR